MATRALGSLVQLLRQFRLQRGGTTTDAELLELFISQRDEDAFETLVRRHGPMVLGVCRRILHNEADVEDCFQATFLVLVRKAASIRPRGMVGNWLYTVARNAALKARAMRRLRHKKEEEAAAEKMRMAADHGQVAEVADTSATLQELLDQELQALPVKYRAAIVLCDLEGMTVPAAAQQVGCPLGTLSARLVRGRAMLGKRLARHGLAVSGGVLATALCQNAASACVPGPLVVSTVQAATLMAAGKALATGAISAKVVALTEGVLKAMLMTKIKVAITVVLAVQLIGAGVGLVYCQTAGTGQTGKETPVVVPTMDRAVVAAPQVTPKAEGKDDGKKDSGTDPKVSNSGADDTLKYYLSKSDLAVHGIIVSEPLAAFREAGVPHYNCDFKVSDVLKGDASLKGKTIRVHIIRFEMDEKDRHPHLKKDGECILFLKGASPDVPSWVTADFWFGVQYPSPCMASSLKRLAAEK